MSGLFHPGHRIYERIVGVLRSQLLEFRKKRRVFTAPVGVEEEQPVWKTRSGGTEDNTPKGRDADPASQKDGRAGCVVMEGQVSERSLDPHFGSERQLPQNTLERRVAHSRCNHEVLRIHNLV
jgi:hypothetical protein